jgi:hypothetical protein
MIKKLLIAAIVLGATAGTTAATAGEGHWSVGKGVQCRIIGLKVVCSSSRP